MRSTRQTIAATAALGLLLVAAGPASAAPVMLDHLALPTRVAAWKGIVMWSRYDPATRTYALVKSVGGRAPVPVGVAPRRGDPFDLDLGTNRTGSTYAVYTRGGDIYRLAVASGRETRIARLSARGLTERDPTIHAGEIAFVRRSRGRDELRIGNTSRRSRGSRLLVRRSAVVMAELAPRHIVYVVASAGPISSQGTKTVRVRNLRTGRDHRVYRSVSGGANYADVTRPSYVARPAGFLWARTNDGSGRGNRLVRYTLRGSRLAYARGSHAINSTAWVDGARGVAIASNALGGRERSESRERTEACPLATLCPVVLTGPPSFTLGP